jgi:hypothetical protein
MTITTETKGSRKAILSRTAGGFVLWVGYTTNGTDDIPAMWFKGHSTCCNEYKKLSAALVQMNKFLNKN